MVAAVAVVDVAHSVCILVPWPSCRSNAALTRPMCPTCSLPRLQLGQSMASRDPDRELSVLLRRARTTAADLARPYGAIPPHRSKRRRNTSPTSTASSSSSPLSSPDGSPSSLLDEGTARDEVVIVEAEEERPRWRIFDDEDDAYFPLTLDEEDLLPKASTSKIPYRPPLRSSLPSLPVDDDPLRCTEEVPLPELVRSVSRSSTMESAVRRRRSWSETFSSLNIFSRSPPSTSPFLPPLPIERAPWAEEDEGPTAMLVQMQSLGQPPPPTRIISNGRHLCMLAAEMAMIRARKIGKPLKQRATRTGKGEALWATSERGKRSMSPLRFEVLGTCCRRDA